MSNGVVRTIEILSALARADRPLGIRDLSSQLGIPKSTTHRILQALESTGAVMTDPARSAYTLGPMILQLGFSFVERLDVRAKALPRLELLREETQETVGLTIPMGDARVYVTLLESEYELRAKPTLGRPYPLYKGAPGRALLAFYPDEEIDKLLARLGEVEAHPDPNSKRVTASQVWRAIEQCRRDGYAMAFEETMPGLNTIAAPVQDHTRSVCAAISVSGPVARLTRPKMRAFAPSLLETATQLSSDLGYWS
jgi:IclR family acetate operon transcriptional repressor